VIEYLMYCDWMEDRGYDTVALRADVPVIMEWSFMSTRRPADENGVGYGFGYGNCQCDGGGSYTKDTYSPDNGGSSGDGEGYGELVNMGQGYGHGYGNIRGGGFIG